jgi:hypothetical protein
LYNYLTIKIARERSEAIAKARQRLLSLDMEQAPSGSWVWEGLNVGTVLLTKCAESAFQRLSDEGNFWPYTASPVIYRGMPLRDWTDSVFYEFREVV